MDATSSRSMIDEFDRLVRRDPARRGLIGSEERFGPLCAGHLAAAAEHLARFGRSVAIVTGFYIPHGDPPAAETDGPLGALMLASALSAVGMEVTLLTDANCSPAVAACARAVGFSAEQLLTYPHAGSDWIEEFLTSGPGRRLTHLISIERVGPSHTRESFLQQQRQCAPPLEEFLNTVPAESCNRCHNMRGQAIDQHTADLYRIFEVVGRFRPEARTIGVGDGANEIGMGAVPWEDLRRRLSGELAPRIPCRIPTDWNIIAGTSNWGGYALAAAVLLLQGRTPFLREWDQHRELSILQYLVEHGPAVDGVTGRRQATVDGLPFLTYIQPWQGIRRLLGFDEG